MSAPPKSAPSHLAPLAIAGAILAVGVLGLVAMDTQGAGLIVAMIETGLAWCF